MQSNPQNSSGVSRSAQKNFRVSKSRSPPRGPAKTEIGTEHIGEMVEINQANINKVKEFMDHVTNKGPVMNNKRISALKNANALKALRDSGFFSRCDLIETSTSSIARQARRTSRSRKTRLRRSSS